MTTTSTATKPKPDRAEINRRNARKSTGPRTTGGKARSKFNAVKHGMTARTLVLPGEDPQKLQLRFETWTDELQPQGEVEQFLLEQAVHSSWKLERARAPSWPAVPLDRVRADRRGQPGAGRGRRPGLLALQRPRQ